MKKELKERIKAYLVELEAVDGLSSEREELIDLLSRKRGRVKGKKYPKKEVEST